MVKTQKCNEDDVNKLDFKVQKLEKVKSFNKYLNSIKEHLKQSFPGVKTLEFTGHKSQLSVIKDFFEDALYTQKLGDNKAPKYKCPKCLHPLSIQHKNDKINIVSYIGEYILEIIVKVNELLSEYNNETTIEVMDDEEIENIKDFKKLILEREAFKFKSKSLKKK